MASVNQRAFRTWYLFALVAGGTELPLLLTFVFLFGSTIEQGAFYSGLPSMLLAISLPIIRFKLKGQGELEGWKTTVLALLYYLLGIPIIGWLLLHLVAMPYWNHAPLSYHKWVGLILLVPLLALLVYLDRRLQECIGKMVYVKKKNR
jgi:hypothetical protein